MTKPRNPPQCGAKTRKGTPCTRTAGFGTDHLGYGRCKHHGGSTPAGIKAAERQAAEQAVVTYGLPREVDPHAALLEELHRTAGHVAWLQLKVSELTESSVYGPVGGGPDSIPRQEPHVYIGLYQAERKHFESIAKTCIACGIAERQIKVLEQHAALFARALDGILTELGVRDRPETRDVVKRHLTVLDGGLAA